MAIRDLFDIREKNVGRCGQTLASFSTDIPNTLVAIVYIIFRFRHDAGWPWVDSTSRSICRSSRELLVCVLAICNVNAQAPPGAAT